MTEEFSTAAIAPTSWRTSVEQWTAEWKARWRNASPRTRTMIQLGVVLSVVAAAYNYSLITLWQEAGVETPLAYISLVPLIALGLAAVQSSPSRAEPPIHDRQVDYIIGLPLIGAALAINLLLPAKLSAMFWVWRVDLLSLPIFVAGVVAIVFGLRIFWRQKLAVGYLLLAWPVPYTMLLLKLLNTFTNVTLDALSAITRILPVAAPDPGGIFTVTHAGHNFTLSVVSACSGVNGMVGFLLVGSAFGAVVRGPLLRKTLWLLSGMALLWAINIGRLLFIFWAGKEWGEHIAIGVFHPVIGLITFSAGVIVMVLAIRPLGMSIGDLPHPVPAALGHAKAVAQHSKVVAVPNIFCAVAVVALAGGILAVSNFNMRVYNLVANAAGEPKLASLSLSPAAPPGWRQLYSDTFTWAQPYFGEGSTWNRYTYQDMSSATLSAGGLPVTADVIDTGDLENFSAYGVLACYQFHGYTMTNTTTVNLGGGITGQTLSFQTGAGGAWSVVWWIVPVRAGDDSTRYERIVLYLLDNANVPIRSPGFDAQQASLDLLSPTDARLIVERAFLVTFARELIQDQSAGSSPAHSA